jgi:hypothetical protein
VNRVVNRDKGLRHRGPNQLKAYQSQVLLAAVRACIGLAGR